jgi:hypothetical protein
MGHRIEWDNEEKSVVLQQYTGEASKDDLYQLALKSSQLIGIQDRTVHLIVDERIVYFVLNSADMSYMEKTTPKNQGAVVVVVRPENMTYKNVVQKLGQRVGPTAFREAYFAESIDAARRFLQENFEVHYSESDLQNSAPNE